VFRVAASAKTAEEQIRNLKNNINWIEQRAQKPGPFIDRVDERGVRRVYPKPG
jgi:hypothetical protein